MKNKIHLLYCPGIYPCKTGGMEIYYYHLIANIKKKFNNDNWIVMTSCKVLVDKHQNYISAKNKLFYTTRFGLGIFSSILCYLFSNKFKWRKIDNIIFPYTGNSYYNIAPILLIKFLFKIPYTIHIHGGGMKSWRFASIQRYFFKHAKNIFGVSPSIIKEYKIRSNKNIKYLPPLLPLKRYNGNIEELKKENNLSDFNKIILFVGSLKPLKSPDTLLKAFNHLGRDFIEEKKVCLLFIGDGPLLSDLIKYRKKNNLEKNVCFLGNVDNKYISKYYLLSNIYVIPSWFEGTPISLLEAKFNAMMCVGSNVKGINNVINNNVDGLLFDKNDNIQLSEILKDILSSKIDSNQFGENAKKEYEMKFNYSEHLKILYESLQ